MTLWGSTAPSVVRPEGWRCGGPTAPQVQQPETHLPAALTCRSLYHQVYPCYLVLSTHVSVCVCV